MILDGFHNRQGIALLPLKKTDKDVAITSGAQLPLKFSKIRRFISYVNPDEDFIKHISGDRGRNSVR